MSVTLAKVLAARPVEVGEDQLDLFGANHTPRHAEACRECTTAELCRPQPPTCWKR